MIESGYDFDLMALIQKAHEAVTMSMSEVVLRQKTDAAHKAREAGVETPAGHSNLRSLAASELSEVYDFILDRLRGYYADKGVPAAQFNAVAELKPASLYDFDRRIEAIGTFAQLPEAAALAAANKRIGNILRKAEGEVQIPHGIDRTLLTDPAEAALAEAVEAALGDTDEALHQHDYVKVLSRLALLREQVDGFFDSVMVNAEDPAVRANRLALLHRLHARFGAVADIAQLSA